MKTKKRAASALERIALIVLSVVMAFPFIWMLSASLKTSDKVLEYPPRLIPDVFRFQNYADVFDQLPFLRYMLNSLIVAGSITVVALVFHSMAGYALGTMRFKGKGAIFVGVISTMMIPFYSIVIPLFVMCQRLGLVDTYLGMILPWIPHAFGIFLMRQYYLTFPRELKEAAVIDGCTHFGVFFKIALPISKSILAALGIIFFTSNWDRFLWPMLITNSPEMRVLPVGIMQFKGQFVVNWHLMMAAAVVGCIPTILVFIFLQDKIVEGVKMSGIKS